MVGLPNHMSIIVEDWQDSGVDPSIVAWFDPHEKTFISFAEQHHLAVAKFLKDMPAWHFVFAHPRGGEGRIDMIRKDESSFSLTASWHKDDYEAGTRSLKWLKLDGPIPSELILDQVKSTLETMLNWTESDFDKTVGGYLEMWHKAWSKEAFERLASRYPRPSLK